MWAVVYMAVLLFSNPAIAADKLHVFVSLLPQQFFVEQIGGDLVDVEVLVGPGQSPATYDPTPRQMGKLARSHIYFRVGVPFENRLIPKIRSTLKNLKIVDTSKGVTLIPMAAHDDHDHDHEGGMDPHIWLDPKRVKQQVLSITSALGSADPANRIVYKENRDVFLQKLDKLDLQLTELLAPCKGRAFMVFHPSFGYFADSYGLKQIPLEQQGKEPSPKQISRWIQIAKSENVKFVFIQSQFSQKTARAVAAGIDGSVISIDPLAPNWDENLLSMARQICQALEEK